jgi:5-methylthioadenosine/S-adenosylhomocysteine deaminase
LARSTTRDVRQRPFGAKYTPDNVYAGDLLSALGAVDSAVTCFLDWSHIHNSPDHSDAAVKALFDSGCAPFRRGQRPERGRTTIGRSRPRNIPGVSRARISRTSPAPTKLVTLFLAAPSASPEPVPADI